jgi:peptidoglycan/LPS O-acetylase OafA/YrhL
MKIQYRPEIDGLRAIAVVSVILYHAQINLFGKQPFNGGFIGVDIFFVISGYLISSIILKELILTGAFSFKYFYERRIRRILPALSFVMLASFPVAWLYLPPSRLIEFSTSILYSLGFSSNFYFYFSGLQYDAWEGLFAPFLHSWSLSVEEQYYILFPALFFLIFKYFQKLILPFLIFSFVISLALAEYLSEDFPSSTFYFIHTRIWELSAGSILAYLEIKHGHRSNNKSLNSIFSIVGTFLIVISFIKIFNHGTPHPSVYTLVPVVGVCLIIWFSSKDTIVTNILSSKIFVWTGLISYSLYLWHYPIFSFAKISGLVSGSFKLKVLLAVLTIIISTVSFFLIEKNFRNKKLNFSKVLKILGISSLIIIIGNFLVIKSNGFPDRFENLKLINKNYNIDNFYLNRNRIPKINQSKSEFIKDKEKVLIIGASHGDDFHNIFFSNKDLFPNYDFAKISKYKLEHIVSNHLVKEADIIVFSFRWNNERINYIFKNTVPELLRNNKRVVIASSTNEYKVRSKMYTLLDEKILFENENIDYFGFKSLYFKNRLLNSNSEINLKLKNLSEKNNLTFLNKEDYLCNLNKKECDYITNDGHKIFYDYGHYTFEGAKYFGQKIYKMNWFNLN